MTEEIKARVELIKKSKLPVGYARKRELIYPQDWGNPVRLNTVLWESKERNKAGVYSRDDVLSVSGQYGVVNQIGLLGRSYAGVSIANYHVVETGDIVYTKSPLKQNPYGIIKLNKGRSGIVSTLYAVYHCNHIITGTYLDFFFTLNTSLNNYLTPLVKKGAKNDMKVNNGDVLKGLISLPPPQEQQKIVEILSTCDRLIALKKELISKKERQKKWLIHKLLERKSHWEVIEIRDLADVCSGATPSTKETELWNGDIRWMNSGELNLKRVYEVEGRISDTGLNNSGTKLLPVNCVLIGLAGQGKTRGTVAINCVELCTNQSIAAIIPNEKFIADFLFWTLEDRYTELRKISSGDGARGGLTLDLIKSVKVYLPTLEEQTAIANILSKSDEELALLNRELAELQRKKKALMQLLLTGIVRVN